MWSIPAAAIMSSNEVLVNPDFADGVVVGARCSEYASGAASDGALGDEVPSTADRSGDNIRNRAGRYSSAGAASSNYCCLSASQRRHTNQHYATANFSRRAGEVECAAELNLRQARRQS